MGKKAEASGVRVPGPNVFIQAVKSEHLPSLSPPNDTFLLWKSEGEISALDANAVAGETSGGLRSGDQPVSYLPERCKFSESGANRVSHIFKCMKRVSARPLLMRTIKAPAAVLNPASARDRLRPPSVPPQKLPCTGPVGVSQPIKP